jgi:hypothetical protein
MRSANEIDFWRGVALVSIFINHIPGFTFERLTHRNFGLSDSAELFVFLAGWSLRLVTEKASEHMGFGRLLLRLTARGVTLYAAHVLITMLAIGLIAAAALTFENPLFLEWHNTAAVFQDPVPTHLGLILLTHHLGFFDILPLYIVLMFAAPVIAAIDRVAPKLLLPASLALYATALTFNLNLPTWPVEGRWYFNPLAWQLTFVLGFVLGGGSTLSQLAARNRTALRLVGAAIVAAAAVIVLSNYEPDPLQLPNPKLFFIFDKTYETPARLIHFLAVAATFAGSFVIVRRYVPRFARFLSMLGRNSLNVFCVGSILSLGGQLVRFIFGGSIGVDTVVLSVGIAVLGFTAWLSELRDRLRVRVGEPAASSS